MPPALTYSLIVVTDIAPDVEEMRRSQVPGIPLAAVPQLPSIELEAQSKASLLRLSQHD